MPSSIYVTAETILAFVHVRIKLLFTTCLQLFKRAFKIGEYDKIGTYDSAGSAMEAGYPKFSISGSGELTLDDASVNEAGR